MRVVSLGTGSFYKWTGDVNKAIAICKDFDIDGVEIMLSNLNRLNQFQPTQENIKYLKGLDFNTIHAPLIGVVYRKNIRTKKVINSIRGIYNKIDAKNVVFHPHNIHDAYYLSKSNMMVSIENMVASRRFSINKIQSILDKNSKFGFVLDVSHAASYSLQRIGEYLDKFQSKITEIHISYFTEKEEHAPIHQCDKQYFEAIKFLKELNAPFVIETHSPKKRLDIYQKDIKFIRKHLIK